MVEECWEGDNIVSLPDLDTESTDVQNIWYSWIPELVSNYSSKCISFPWSLRETNNSNDRKVDGLRLDSALEVQQDFWPSWVNASGVYCVGEVDNGDTTIACPYQKYLDGILNYPTYFPLVRAFESTSGSISDLYNMVNTVKSDCSDSNLLGSFSENHDNPRFASYTSDFSLAKNVLAFTILSDGIPIIYAGQEQHYSGSSVPTNREATWLSGFDTSAELYTWIAKLNQIRNYALQWDNGYTTYKVCTVFSSFESNHLTTVFRATQSTKIATTSPSAKAATKAKLSPYSPTPVRTPVLTA